MARVRIADESKRDADGRIIREGKTTQPRRTPADGLGLANLDSGTQWGPAGALSLSAYNRKLQEESDQSDEYLQEKAQMPSEDPPSPSSASVVTVPSTSYPSSSDELQEIGKAIQAIDGLKKSAPVRSMMNSGIERVIQKNMPAVEVAVQEYFDQLNSPEGDKTVKKHFRDNFMSPDALREMEKSQAKMLAEHIDFQQYRIFKRGHEYQQMMMLSKTVRTYMMAGRRAGKTEGLQLLISNEIVHPDRRVLVIGLTFETTSSLFWHPVLRTLDELDIQIAEKKTNEGILRLSNGSMVKFTGNSTADEREKLRGGKWNLAIIDEAQSQKALIYLVRDIIEPMLLDYKGRLYIGGTGPRVRGTFWEKVWLEDKAATKLNWNLTQNPFIPDHDAVLEQIMQEKGVKENDPLMLREYFGKIAYDDDALVLRFKENNYFTEETFLEWIRPIPRTDIRFVGGLDYGYSDSDGFCILCYSESKQEVFVVYQHKAAREGIEQLKRGIMDGLEYLKTDTMFQGIPMDLREDFYIYADSSDTRASYDLSVAMSIGIYPAMKHDKQAGVDMLQDDCRKGYLKVPLMKDNMSPLEDEGLRTVFLRDDRDNLTREIDDDSYHPDMIPAVIYAARSGPWMYRPRMNS